MPKSNRQKMKLLYLMSYLLEESDEAHPVGVSDMIRHLDTLAIKAERKSIYDDIECLREFGMDIVFQGGKGGGYFVGERTFELPELKLLVDAVQSSKFITAKKSNVLIKKLGSLTGKYTKSRLERQVFVANRVKTMNESIYFNVDAIQSAMIGDRKIAFKYSEWTRDGKKRFRHNGRLYLVSPLSLIWDDENYYLVAFDSDSEEIRHYRVDKMSSITESEEQRTNNSETEDFDPAVYSKQMFGMFGGESELVTLCCDNSLAGVVFDRFGGNLPLRYPSDDKFEIVVRVAVSPVFFGWVFGFGGRMQITAPRQVRDKFRELLSQHDI